MELLHNGPPRAAATLVLAHGAGAPMDSPFMEALAEGLADRDLAVVRFEFPYMRKRRAEGGRRPPDRTPVLMTAWREAVATVAADRLVVGGKSMGGRIASMIADHVGASGLVCLGYPFHPPGKPDRLRTGHLAELETPTLIVQGTRDRFGTPDEVAGYDLSAAIRVAWIDDGDHSLTPRKSSGRTAEQNLAEAVDAVASFVEGLA